MRIPQALFMLVAALAVPACMQVKGVAVTEGTGQPNPYAILTIGKPDGTSNWRRQPVDPQGRFDFSIDSASASELYIYDSSWGIGGNLRRIDPRDISDHMRVTLPKPNVGTAP